MLISILYLHFSKHGSSDALLYIYNVLCSVYVIVSDNRRFFLSLPRTDSLKQRSKLRLVAAELAAVELSPLAFVVCR